MTLAVWFVDVSLEHGHRQTESQREREKERKTEANGKMYMDGQNSIIESTAIGGNLVYASFAFVLQKNQKKLQCV